MKTLRVVKIEFVVSFFAGLFNFHLYLYITWMCLTALKINIKCNDFMMFIGIPLRHNKHLECLAEERTTGIENICGVPFWVGSPGSIRNYEPLYLPNQNSYKAEILRTGDRLYGNLLTKFHDNRSTNGWAIHKCLTVKCGFDRLYVCSVHYIFRTSTATRLKFHVRVTVNRGHILIKFHNNLTTNRRFIYICSVDLRFKTPCLSLPAVRKV